MVDKTKVCLLIDNKSLEYISTIIYSNIVKIGERIKWHIWNDALGPKAAGNFMDILHFQAFRNGIEFFRIYKLTNTKEFREINYRPKESIPFQGSKQLNLKETLS